MGVFLRSSNNFTPSSHSVFFSFRKRQILLSAMGHQCAICTSCFTNATRGICTWTSDLDPDLFTIWVRVPWVEVSQPEAKFIPRMCSSALHACIVSDNVHTTCILHNRLCKNVQTTCILHDTLCKNVHTTCILHNTACTQTIEFGSNGVCVCVYV